MIQVRKIAGGLTVSAVVLGLVSCHGTEATYTIGGDLSGSTVPVVLKLNGGNDISKSGDGSFKFDKKLLKGDTFNVQIVDPGDRCTVANGAGTVDMSNITNVSINCIVRTDPSVASLAVVRSAVLNGAQVNLPVTTNAFGVGGVVVDPRDPANIKITGGITLVGLSPFPGTAQIVQTSAGHPGDNGTPIITLFIAAGGATAVVPANTILSFGQYTSLLAGELYFTVGTALNKNGEIRGAIELQGGVAANSVPLGGAQEVPPVTTTTAGGNGTVLVDRATFNVLVAYVTHTVSGATAADIHTGTDPVASAGTVVAFTDLETDIDPVNNPGTNLAAAPSGARMTAGNLTDFDNSLLYYNVRSGANPRGEIRGNISSQ